MPILTFTILNSPYSDLEINKQCQTVHDLIKLIQSEYNDDQETTEYEINVFLKNDQGYILLAKTFDLISFLNSQSEYSYHRLIIINENIKKRIYKTIRPVPDFSKLQHGLMRIQFCDPLPTKSYKYTLRHQIIPFMILNKTKNRYDLISLQPLQLNWSRGPTKPQRFFCVLKNGQIGIDCEITFKNRIQLIVNGIHPYYFGCNDVKKIDWNQDHEHECFICLDQDVNSIIEPCHHPVVCLNCSKNLTHCPQCQKQIERIIPAEQILFD